MEEPKLNSGNQDNNLEYPFFFMNFIFYTTKNIHIFPQDIIEGHKFLNTKPFFQHPKLKLLNPTDKIFFCAQPNKNCFLSNFMLIFFNNEVNCKIIDKWRRESPLADHLIPMEKEQQREIENGIAHEGLTNKIPGKAQFLEATFKIYKKKQDDQ